MLAAKYNAFRKAILDHILGVAALAAPATVTLRLYTVAPTAAGGGTLVNGGGYANKTIAWDGSIVPAASALGVAPTAEDISFGAAEGADWGEIVAVDIIRGDDGALMYFATLDEPVTVLDGQGFAFNAGDLEFSET